MVSNTLVCYARHSETLEWHAVFAEGDGFRAVASPPEGKWIPSVDLGFQPTHVHYKGGLYRVERQGRVEGDGAEATLYRDGKGNWWLRPRLMFEGRIEDGRLRFAPFRVPGCL